MRFSMNSPAAKLTSLAPLRRALSPDAASMARTMNLAVVRNEADFLALAPHWDNLLARSAVRTPFLTWDWVSLWWAQYRDTFELAVCVVRDRTGSPVAIAPMMIGRPSSGARRHLRHITFLGGLGEITSEGLDFIVPCGLESSLVPVLCQMITRMRSRWDVVFLPMIHEDSPNLPVILEALSGRGSGGKIVERQPSRFINLPDSWDDVEMSHGQNWRSNYRRKWKKMLSHHAGRPRQGGLDIAADDAFHALYMLHSQRWSPGESHFLREPAKSFHRQLVQRWLSQDRLSISILELDGAPGAATYCFHHDGRSWFYQAGWNSRYSGISIGKLAIGWAVQCAIQRGHTAFDFLPGDMPYKREWSDAVRHVVDFEAFNPTSLRAALFRLLRSCKRRTIPVGTVPPAKETGTDAAE